jgi:DnaJ family protein C protein 9
MAATTIANAFGEGANLYTVVLALEESGPSVSHAHIRRAYYKRCLAFHPDKLDTATLTPEEIEDAKAKFQAVSVAYNILSNEESRSEYDETGELYEDDDDDAVGKSGTDQWAEYFSGIFGKVGVEDIEKFELAYKCSDEEERDVKKYYVQFKGDLNKCLECVMCSREEDKKRWWEDYIKPAIAKGDLEDHSSEIARTLGGNVGGEEGDNDEEMSANDDDDDDEMTETESDSDEEKKKASPPESKGKKAKGSAKAKREQPSKKGKDKKPAAKKKASKTKKSAGSGVPDDLIAAIRGNAVARSQQSFDHMMAGLEERYGGGKKKKGGKKSQKQSDPDDIPIVLRAFGNILTIF